MQPGFFERFGLTVHVGDAVASIDPAQATVTSRNGRTIVYDALVLATGSYPFVPPLPGNDAPGCFVYRTLDDLEAIRAYAKDCRAGAVVGGGLLGLEAANALRCLGLDTHVVEFADRLMPVQIDDGGSSALRRRIEELGVKVHTSMRTEEILRDRRGRVRGMKFANEGVADLPVGMVVFSAGIRPRDELARAAGLQMGERGGIVVDEACRTSDPRIYAIGECALALTAASLGAGSTGWWRPATTWPGWWPTASSAAVSNSPSADGMNALGPTPVCAISSRTLRRRLPAPRRTS